MAVDTEDIRNRDLALLRERQASIENLAKDVSEYLAPARGRYPGDDRKPDQAHGKRGSKIIDSTPVDCFEIAYNGMFSGLTSPSRPWHRTKFEDRALNEYGPAKLFMDAVSERRNALLRSSNFYSSIHSAFAEVIAFANCLLMMREFEAGGFVFRPFTFGEYCWSRGANGKIDTVYRHEWMSAKQMVEEFGETAVSRQVREAITNNRPYLPFEVLHAVEPRAFRDVSRRDVRNKRFRSVWMELSNDKNLLRESGFDDFPYAGAGWLMIGSDNYGCNSPGVQSLPDNKMLQDMEESCLMATHQELDPSLQVPSTQRGQPIRKTAGGVTYVDSTSGEGGIKRLFEFKFDLQAGEAKSEAIRQRIRKTFKNDIFMMISAAQMNGRQPPTATQIMIMDANNKTQLGPFIERLEDELLDPIVTFVTQRIMARPWLYGVPEPPQEVWGQAYKIEYVSLLAQAQQMTGTQAINEGLVFAETAAQVNPEVLDNYDFDEMAREHGDLIGIPPRLMRSQDQVAKVREVRAQKMAAAEQAQMAMAAAQGAKTLSETKTDEPNALTALLGGQQQ